MSEEFPKKLKSKANSNMDLKAKITSYYQFKDQFTQMSTIHIIFGLVILYSFINNFKRNGQIMVKISNGLTDVLYSQIRRPETVKISPNSDIDSRIYKLKSHFFQNAIFQNVFCYLTKSSRICLEKQIAKG